MSDIRSERKHKDAEETRTHADTHADTHAYSYVITQHIPFALHPCRQNTLASSVRGGLLMNTTRLFVTLLNKVNKRTSYFIFYYLLFVICYFVICYFDFCFFDF